MVIVSVSRYASHFPLTYCDWPKPVFSGPRILPPRSGATRANALPLVVVAEGISVADLVQLVLGATAIEMTTKTIGRGTVTRMMGKTRTVTVMKGGRTGMMMVRTGGEGAAGARRDAGGAGAEVVAGGRIGTKMSRKLVTKGMAPTLNCSLRTKRCPRHSAWIKGLVVLSHVTSKKSPCISSWQ
jgi:hypothetical protein